MQDHLFDIQKIKTKWRVKDWFNHIMSKYNFFNTAQALYANTFGTANKYSFIILHFIINENLFIDIKIFSTLKNKIIINDVEILLK